MVYLDAERAICEAVKKRVVVELKYDDDLYFRQYEPVVVYRSSKQRTLVDGYETSNPNDSSFRPDWHTFGIDKIKDIRLTSTSFVPNSGFNRSDARYKHGIICEP